MVYTGYIVGASREHLTKEWEVAPILVSIYTKDGARLKIEVRNGQGKGPCASTVKHKAPCMSFVCRKFTK